MSDKPGSRWTKVAPCPPLSLKLEDKSNNKILLSADSLPGNILYFGDIMTNQTETFLELKLREDKKKI